MLDFDRLVTRFRQFGGWRLMIEYIRMGLLWTIVGEIMVCIFKGRSFKCLYPAICKKVNRILISKYCCPICYKDYKQKDASKKEERKVYVWWCWIQGLDNAPAMAKVCYESLKENLKNVEIVAITADNYAEWVDLPDYLIEKYEKGIMPHASFSDLIRLALLLKYGGVWIDSTVLCTGTEATKYCASWDEMLNADLFVFQYTKPDEAWSGNISNWFIAAHPGNQLLENLFDMLCRYWRDYDCLVQYYIFHLFFAELSKGYHDMIARMPYGWSVPSLQLGRHLDDKYDERKWERFKKNVCWHKMNYRFEDKLKGNMDNYYHHLCCK